MAQNIALGFSVGLNIILIITGTFSHFFFGLIGILAIILVKKRPTEHRLTRLGLY